MLGPGEGMIGLGRNQILDNEAYKCVRDTLLPPYRNRGLFSEDIKGQGSHSETEEQEWGLR